MTRRKNAKHKRNAVAKREVGKVHEAPDHLRPGWLQLGHAYEGRKRPDGLDQGWC